MPKTAFLRHHLEKKQAKVDNAGHTSPSFGACGQVPAGRGARAMMLLLFLLPMPFLAGWWGGSQKMQDVLREFKIQGLGSITKVGFKGDKIFPSPSQSLRQAALEFVKQREQAYLDEKVHPRWKMRGHGHLYTYEKIVLAGNVHLHSGKNDGMAKSMSSVLIFNVHPETYSTFQDCHLLTLWVRVEGPEIMAGKAQPVFASDASMMNGTNAAGELNCYWKFDFVIQVPGNYTVDAKIIQWNGSAKVKFYQSQYHDEYSGKSQCAHVQSGNIITQEAYHDAPQNTSFLGFKLYGPLQGCCEICRRVPHCKYWATPPQIMPRPSLMSNGCELFFGPDVNPVEDIPHPHILQSQIDWQNRIIENEKQVAAQKAANPVGRHRRLDVIAAWGSPDSDNEQVQQFLGCGWSYFHSVEFPCISGDLDDHVFLEDKFFVVEEEPGRIMGPHQQVPLPLCELQDEFVLSNTNAFSRAKQQYRNATFPMAIGRWVREPYPNIEQCPSPYEIYPSSSFSSMSPISISDPARPHCWFRDDLNPLSTRCMEGNCGFVQKSHRWNASKPQHEQDWMAVWRNYHCDYQEFTNDQLSQCFQMQKIVTVEKAGTSIAAMLERYISSRLDNVTFYDANAADGKRVIFHTLAWPHVLWNQPDDLWESHLDKSIPTVLNTNTIAFWVTPFFTSSEREPYVHLERAIKLMDVAERIVTPKGYQMLNGFDPSAALTYDTAGQGDGMHIVGPPMKALTTKLFHHLCASVVNGTRL